MTYAVTLKEVESQPLAVVHRQATPQSLSTVIPEACGIVWDALKALQIRGGRHVAVYWDAQINVDVGTEVDGSFAGTADVSRSDTPAGRVLTTVHFGGYDRLVDAHHAIRDWAGQNHQTLAGPNWEIYGHWTDDLSQLRTDVFYLLKGA
jgi:effector-binding domain-containing protein